jgi:uncharacterized protein (DUF305 family)
MRRGPLVLASVALAATATVTACGSDGDSPSASAPSTTASVAEVGGEHNAADVTFAQMMIPHHQQAVEMARLARDRAADPAVKALAEQIEAAQAPEIETMTGWLAAWGEPTAPPSGGMGGGHDMAAMPGMMSAEDMVGLEAVSGADFDRMFLTMMIRHHEGAIEMARTEQSDGRFPDAVALARTIETTQVAEIETMRELLGNA